MHCKPKCFIIQYNLKVYSNKGQEVLKLQEEEKEIENMVKSGALLNTVV